MSDSIANVRSAFQPDGSLFDLGWYLGWGVSEPTACLDGDFTAAELRAIADVMDGKPLPPKAES